MRASNAANVCYHITRVSVGLIFAYSALVHLQNTGNYLVSILNYRIIPSDFGPLLAFVLPVLHLVIGLSLMLSEFEFLSAIVGSMLLVSYIIAQVFALFSGLTISCGCFGSNVSEPVGVGTVLRTIVLLCFSCFLIVAARSRGNAR